MSCYLPVWVRGGSVVMSAKFSVSAQVSVPFHSFLNCELVFSVSLLRISYFYNDPEDFLIKSSAMWLAPRAVKSKFSSFIYETFEYHTNWCMNISINYCLSFTELPCIYLSWPDTFCYLLNKLRKWNSSLLETWYLVFFLPGFYVIFTLLKMAGLFRSRWTSS